MLRVCNRLVAVMALAEFAEVRYNPDVRNLKSNIPILLRESGFRLTPARRPDSETLNELRFLYALLIMLGVIIITHFFELIPYI